MAADVQAGARVRNKEIDLSSQFDHVFWCGDLNYRLDLQARMESLVRMQRSSQKSRNCSVPETEMACTNTMSCDAR